MTERTIKTDIEINAAPDRVWEALTDFEAMPSWNPFIRSISGELSPGSRLQVRIAPPGKMAMTFRPTLLTVHPNRELRWLGRLLLPRIFDGEHYFLITPLDGTRVRFTQGERFAGILVGFMGGMLSATEKGFETMNRALKERVET